jgi:hypothetical protein
LLPLLFGEFKISSSVRNVEMVPDPTQEDMLIAEFKLQSSSKSRSPDILPHRVALISLVADSHLSQALRSFL